MSDKAVEEKASKLGSGSGHESPTTARELDFDDDDDTPAAPGEQAAAPPAPAKSPKPGVRFSDDATEIPPAKPPRPVSPRQTATTMLIEAFPETDPTTVRGILMASDWNADKAFDVLLKLSDPNYKDEDAPPPKPPRPTRKPMTQLEADEQYARRLAEQYNSEGHGSRSTGDPRRPRQQQRRDSREDEDQGLFNKDDLDEIKQTLEQGFKGAQNTFNNWIQNVKKKLDGPEGFDHYGNETYRRDQRQDFGPSQSDQLHGIRKSAEMRRSADHNRYDSDNRMLDDDFEALELRDDESYPNQRSNRPLANPDLFKPTPVSPPQTGPVDEVDALYRNPSPNGQQTGVAGNKSGGKKWQPLTSVAPHPETDEHDPFSLGDSDDEEAKTKDIKAEDTERLKKAAETKKTDESAPVGLTPAGRSGSVGQKDAAAEALLSDAK